MIQLRANSSDLSILVLDLRSQPNYLIFETTNFPVIVIYLCIEALDQPPRGGPGGMLVNRRPFHHG